MAASISRIVLVFCVIVATVFSQQNEPIHCCFDAQSISVERILQGGVNGTQVGAQMITQTAATDYDQSLVGAEGTITDSEGKTYEYKVIENFDIGYGWTIVNGVCTQFEFGGDLPGNCVPYDRDIEYIGPVRFMGFVPSQSWRLVLWPGVGARGIADFIVTEDGCIPVQSSFRGQDTSFNPPTDAFQSVYFFNYTRGIADYDRWFKLPPDCPQFTKKTKSAAKLASSSTYPPLFRSGTFRIPKPNH